MIYWLGKYKWFRKLCYWLTDRPLWGMRQFMADIDYEEDPDKFDREQFTKDINEFMEEYYDTL